MSQSNPSRGPLGVALVTGCSSGIGRALARELASRGQRCFATARRDESLRELEVEGLEAIRLDVTDVGSVRAAVDEVLERAGRVDLLVNNAGQSLFGPLAELPLERVDALFAANLRGPLAVAQAVIPAMARQRSGRIANVGSLVGIVPTPWSGAYCASKAALHALSEVLRMEVAPWGIEVVTVVPGAVRSEVANNAPLDLERYAAPGSLYRGEVERIRRRSQASQQRPTEAADFARALADALVRPRLPRELRIGAGTAALPLLTRIPRALRERLLVRRFGPDPRGPRERDRQRVTNVT